MKEIIRPKKGGIKYYLSLLILLVCSTGTFGQSRPVTGKVVDSQDGLGLVGVAVYLKGTQIGTVTDIDGNFALDADEANTLVFSFIGYVTQEIPVGARTTIDVSLEVDVQELSEVVVIGYGQVEEGDVTGVINKIDEGSFNKGMLTTPEQLIAGKVAGVQITNNSGEPGGGITVRMRGGTSITASNDPLYVVDGVPLSGEGVAGSRNPLNFINPSDIADISVLKDASAAAIYGSRGANGVIIITTKTGKSGKPKFTYDGSTSIGNIIDRIEMLSAEEFVFTVERKGSNNISRLGVDDVYYDTDWLGEVLQTAVGQNHNLSASFGIKENTKARISLNYQNLDGILKTSNTERIAGSINISQKLLNDDLTIKWSSKHSITNNRFAPNVVESALTYAPTQPIFVNDSTYFQWDNSEAPRNPVEQIANTNNIGKVERNLISLSIDYNLPFIEGLSIKSNYAYDISTGLSQVTEPVAGAFDLNGNFTYKQEERISHLFEGYINYLTNTSIGVLDLMGGYSYQDFDLVINDDLLLQDSVLVDELSISEPLKFIDDEKLNQIQPSLAKQLPFRAENRLISFWGRANLSINDKYLITATLRADGSTKFAEQNRWGLFPSLAAGWRIIDEPFMNSLLNTFSNLKLRLSYGITGNQDIDDYLYEPLYNPSDERAQYRVGEYTTTLRPNAVDPNIKWEQTESLNLGIDYGFFGGRLNGSIDLYRKYTKDLLFDIAFPIGTLTGDKATTNIGEIENKGIEFLLNSIVISKEDTKLELSFNAAYNRNEIIKLDNSNLPDFQGYITGGISGNQGQTIQVYKVGESVNSFFVWEHILDENGNPIPDGEDTNGDGLSNDTDSYVDINNDGIVNENDLRPYKDPAPDWILGLTANLSHKQFDIAATLRGQIGNYVYNNVFSQFGAYQGTADSFAPRNIHISAYENDFTDMQLFSDVYVENGSFIKLDNITLGYRFPSKSSFNARAYITASNIFNVSGYSGIDPEAGGFSGIDNNLYPLSRTYLVGVNLTF